MSLSQQIVADFEEEATHTRKVLEAVPGDRLDWKPHEKSMSLGQLAGHIAETPSWLAAMLEDEMDFASMPADYKPFVPTSPGELAQTFETNACELAKSLADRDDAFMQATWTMKKGDQVITTSGIIGRVHRAEEKEVVIQVDKDSNVKVRFLKSAVSEVLTSGKNSGKGAGSSGTGSSGAGSSGKEDRG